MFIAQSTNWGCPLVQARKAAAGSSGQLWGNHCAMPHGYSQADSLLLVMKRLACPNCQVLLEVAAMSSHCYHPPCSRSCKFFPCSPPLFLQISSLPFIPPFSMAGASKALLFALESAPFTFASAALR